MPFKQKLKKPSANPRKKPSYKVTNCTEYNKSLKKRGALSLYFPYGNLKDQFINEENYVIGLSGQQATYKPAYIQLIYTFYRLFDWGIRQITGYFEDLWQGKGLDIAVPSFGHLSDLFSTLSIKIKQSCAKLAKRIENGESVSLILDSSGFRFGKASHWYETKYEKPCEIRPWRKMHLSIDTDMNMHAIEITDCNVSDIEVMKNLIPENSELSIGEIIADGGYYSIEGVEVLDNKRITPIIPPPANSIIHGRHDTKCHDKNVQYIKDKRSVYAFHKKYDYGRRSLVESQISRIKRCIGSSLKTQRTESQDNEGVIIANLINTWNSFGGPISVIVG